MNDLDINEMLSLFDKETDIYQRDAVEEALSRRQELTPYLIKIIETVADNPLIYSLEQRTGHIYAAALLSHFEETAAHLPLIRAFSIPSEQMEEIWGDMSVDILPTFLYRTCGGSLEAIMELAANRTVDQYVRSSAMEALSYVVAFQPSRRDEVIPFLQGLYIGEEAEDDSYLGSYLAGVLCDLHPGESMDTLRRAHEAGMIHPDFISLENIEAENAKSPESVLERFRSQATTRIPADIHGYFGYLAESNQKESVPSPRPNAKRQGKKKTRRVKCKYKAGKKPGKKKRR